MLFLSLSLISKWYVMIIIEIKYLRNNSAAQQLGA